MRKIVQTSILIGVIGIILVKTPVISVVSAFLYSSPCDTPIHYKIGYIDARFHLSQKEFLADIQDAGTVWSHVVGKTLFQYDQQFPDSLSINLVFDDRQSLNNKIT